MKMLFFFFFHELRRHRGRRHAVVKKLVYRASSTNLLAPSVLGYGRDPPFWSAWGWGARSEALPAAKCVRRVSLEDSACPSGRRVPETICVHVFANGISRSITAGSCPQLLDISERCYCRRFSQFWLYFIIYASRMVPTTIL